MNYFSHSRLPTYYGQNVNLNLPRKASGKANLLKSNFSKTQAVEPSNWQAKIDAGVSFVTVSDFVVYDSILTHTLRLGMISPQFTWDKTNQRLRKAIILPSTQIIKTQGGTRNRNLEIT